MKACTACKGGSSLPLFLHVAHLHGGGQVRHPAGMGVRPQAHRGLAGLVAFAFSGLVEPVHELDE